MTIKDTIPEPDFTLKAPKHWDGRDPIEIVPAIGNLEAMKAQGEGDLHYRWTVSGGAVIKQIAPDRLILKRSQYTGPITVTAAIDNGGAATVVSAEIQVTEPKTDPWVQRVRKRTRSRRTTSSTPATTRTRARSTTTGRSTSRRMPCS